MPKYMELEDVIQVFFDTTTTEFHLRYLCFINMGAFTPHLLSRMVLHLLIIMLQLPKIMLANEGEVVEVLPVSSVYILVVNLTKLEHIF